MFAQSSPYYDAIYASKDYAAEANTLANVITARLGRPGRTLLDVACGTGRHLEYFRPWLTVEGIDLNEDLLAAARARLPDVTFHAADMRSFDLGRQFEVVTCLFSAIAYVVTVEGLNAAIANMARHVAPGGLLIVEPWWPPEKWVVDNRPHATFVDRPDLKLARIARSRQSGMVSIIDFSYVIGTPEGIVTYTEEHRTGLFTIDEQTQAFQMAGLSVTHDANGISGRGLFVGVKSAA